MSDAIDVIRDIDQLRRDLTIPHRSDGGECTMEPDGYYGEQYGIYRCSNCGQPWQFEVDGPREHGWTCCPRCRSVIDYGEAGR